MPGLVPGIHVFFVGKDVDGRDKPGHDALMRHFTGATATAIVQTSWPRLTISRLSLGPM
jgi:hypothetical protein